MELLSSFASTRRRRF
uniref:Uncharacterized protein n=1 Tax=Anguilla anguilla TaxID=7936 RepID=A0A0E9T9B7_ANGAN